MSSCATTFVSPTQWAPCHADSHPTATAPPKHCFDGIATSPFLNDLLEERSQKLFASSGILAWQGAGGQVGSDGRLGFRAFSTPALQVVNTALADSHGFRWSDGGGTWAARLIRDKHDATRHLAHAISFDGAARLLDPQARARWAEILGERIALLTVPGRAWDQDDRQRHVRLQRCARQIQRAAEAEHILLHLHRARYRADGGEILIPARELAVSVWPHESDRPADWVTDLSERLRGVLGFQLAVLELSRFGWQPRILTQAAAVSSVEMRGVDNFRVGVSPLLAEVLETFARRTSTENSGESA